MRFFSISTLRQDIAKYNKKDSYTNCESDLCSFFKEKTIEEVFNLPILLAPSDDFRYIKSRVENCNLNSGKSGAYRLYYYVDKPNEHIFLLGFYPKAGKYGRGDLSNTEEKQMIQLFKSERKSGSLIEHDIANNLIVIEAKTVAK